MACLTGMRSAAVAPIGAGHRQCLPYAPVCARPTLDNHSSARPAAQSCRGPKRGGLRGMRGPKASRMVAAAATEGQEYDYVIVGGGTAGCVLANRLSLDESKRVLVLEAGEDNKDVIVSVPSGIAKLFKHKMLDWGLFTERLPKVDDREVYIARGKLLGGSSSTNATLYHRGTREDYDAWGVPGWGADDILPWFVASEDNIDFDRGFSRTFHGTGGAMKVELPRYENVLHRLFFDAAEQMGLQNNPDFNDWSRPQEGYGTFQVTQERGRRADAYRQYLKPALGRSNLKVVTGAQTSRIITEKVGSGVRAVGVEFQDKKGETQCVSVPQGGEVLLAAGAVHSPQILMLSGIGPQQHLQEHGIDVVADLPGVGQQLQDHPACLTTYLTTESLGPVAITDQIYRPSGQLRTRAVLNYLLRRKGPLTSTACDRGAFVRTTPDAPQPDLQIRLAPGCALDADGVNSYVRYGELIKEGRKWPTGVTFQLIAVRPKSTGCIRLRSSDVADAPMVDTGYLSDSGMEDISTLKRAIQLSRQLAETPAMAAVIDSELHPGPSCSSAAELESYIRRTLHSANAVVGSCRMGTRAADGAVVGPDLVVHGVDGLRVVDASVIPRIPGAQTAAAVVMIAERAAAALASDNALSASPAAAMQPAAA